MVPSYRALKNYAKQQMGKNSASHDWLHVSRTYNFAKQLCAAEGGDWSVVAPAVLLHDIVRPSGKRARNHALESAIKAERLLKMFGFREVGKIKSCILKHSEYSGLEPRTLEEKIVWDADKLDGFSVFGMARWFVHAGECGWNVKKAAEGWLNAIRGRRTWFYTETARELASSALAQQTAMMEHISGYETEI